MALEGFRHARGFSISDEGIAASAFSRGDLLMYDSNSSLSRADTLFPAGADIAGVAKADSTDSINDLVPYEKPQADSVYWSRITNAVSSDLTKGQELDVEVDGNGRHYVNDSTNSARLVVEQGTQDIDQSDLSRALVKFIRHAGNVEHS